MCIQKGICFMEKGTIFKFHNDLDTDQIIASQYLLLPNLEEMKSHAFESLDPDFAQKVKPGDIIEIQFGTRTVKVEVLDIKDTTKKEEAGDLFKYL